MFNKLFSKNKNETPIDNTSTPNIDELVEKARNSGRIEDLNNMYSALFELNDWNYIVSKNCSIEDPKPFIGIVDEQPWLFVFTDRKKANQYARTFGHFHQHNESTLVLTMSVDSSLNMVHQLHERGVFGIRINEGENGFFTDIPGLFNIKNHLNK